MTASSPSASGARCWSGSGSCFRTAPRCAENRYINGVSSTTLINPDLVGEMRVILTPVDAETGRGNGQVQILTRSGTNRFKGSAVWAIRNSALDANTWSNNGNVGLDGKWSPTKPNWTNRHQATVSYGGPIIKNKTFFFALYDQQIERRRSTQRPVVLTDCARNGIFRYWEGWANGNTDTVTNTASLTNSIRPSVDFAGNPVAPTTNPNGTPYTGQLRYFSVFGPVVNTPTQPDCSDAVVQGTPWDANRTKLDPGRSEPEVPQLHATRQLFWFNGIRRRWSEYGGASVGAPGPLERILEFGIRNRYRRRTQANQHQDRSKL